MGAIHAEFEAMDEAAAQLRTKQEALEATLNEALELVNALTEGAFDTPEASSAFRDAVADFVESNQQNIANWESFAAWLEGAGQTLAASDGDLATSVSV